MLIFQPHHVLKASSQHTALTMGRKMVQSIKNPKPGGKRYIRVPLEYPSSSSVTLGTKRPSSEQQAASSKRSRPGSSLKDEGLWESSGSQELMGKASVVGIKDNIENTHEEV